MVRGWREMDNTLDRLKALNSKLEQKLSEKKKVVPKSGEEKTAKPKSGSLIETPATDTKPETDASPALAKKSGRKKEAVEGSLPAVEAKLLHRRLLVHLGIDATAEPVRSENLARLVELYGKLGIEKKVPRVEDIFVYKAMNISGIGLKEEDFGEIREGKYVQVIAITYEPDKNGKKKAKNISLGYFGKAETLEAGRKNEVIEFVLRWRYEKAFQNLEHYRILLEKVRPKETLF